MSSAFSTLENSAQNNSPGPTQVVPAGQGPAQRLSLMYSGCPTWSLHLVEVPASYFPLELALGCYILGTNTLALWFSFLLLGNFIPCNQITRCWVGEDEVMAKNRTSILPLVFSGLMKSLWERRKVGKIWWGSMKVVLEQPNLLPGG